jgi:hypothetical protein
MPLHASKRPNRRFILPFTTPAKNRLKDFTKNMEMAAVLYLAEANRKKGEQPRLKKIEEKLVFIAEACYPIWLVPYNAATLMFDGLGLTSHTFSWDVTPDVEIFNKDLRRNQKTTQAYTAALTRNLDYFGKFQGKEEIKIEGLVTSTDLKADLRNYLPLMKDAKKPPANKILLKTITKTHEIQTSMRQLSTLKKKSKIEINNINASMKFLNTTTARRVKSIKEEIKKTRETQENQIKNTKVRLAKRLRRIQTQYNQKITKTSKRHKKRLLQLNKNQVKLGKKLRSLRNEARRCETRKKSSKRRKRKRNETLWNRKLQSIKRKIKASREKIKSNNKRIRDVENKQKHELAKKRAACCLHIESANKKFLDLQGSREAEIIMKRQEIATLEEITRYITNSMQEMLQKKKSFNTQFEKMVISPGKQTRRLVYIPFYLARYEKGNNRRYIIYPPSTAGDMGILARMRGALGATKVKALIQSRSEAVETFLNQLPTLFEKKLMIEKEVTEAGIQKSILLRKNLRIGVTKGLKRLEDENWISKKELCAFTKILYTYTASMKGQLNVMLIPGDNYLKCIRS